MRRTQRVLAPAQCHPRPGRVKDKRYSEQRQCGHSETKRPTRRTVSAHYRHGSDVNEPRRVGLHDGPPVEDRVPHQKLSDIKYVGTSGLSRTGQSSRLYFRLSTVVPDFPRSVLLCNLSDYYKRRAKGEREDGGVEVRLGWCRDGGGGGAVASL